METSVNNKCKAFTSLEQSRKLEEILPLESADMYYTLEDFVDEDTGDIFSVEKVSLGHPSNTEIGCWSLAALLEQLKAEIQLENKQILFLHINKYDDINYEIRYTNSWTGEVFITEAENPVDACYEMILKLYELNLV